MTAVPDKVHYIQSNSEVVALAKTSVLRENLIAPTINLRLRKYGRSFENQSPQNQEIIESNLSVVLLGWTVPKSLLDTSSG